jgi:type I restriction enzyme R subunit
MSDVGQVERKAQERVVRMFRDQLGYEYLGNWEYREGNSNIESGPVDSEPHGARGYDDNLITRTLDQLGKACLGRRWTRPLRGEPETCTACCATA